MNAHTRKKSSTFGRFAVATFVVVLLGLIGGLIWSVNHPTITPPDEPEMKHLTPPQSPTSVTPTPSSGDSSASSEPVVAQCKHQATLTFSPIRVQLLGVATYPADPHPLVKTADGVVLPVPADENLTRFAVVSTDRAADDSSMVRLTAHTYEGHDDALGNVVAKRVPVGAIIVLRGEYKSDVACYKVTFRDKVTVARGASDAEKAKARRELNRYNGVNQADDLGIMVCAGKRLGSGNYTERLNVFATRYGV